jgi:hypothetical protein
MKFQPNALLSQHRRPGNIETRKAPLKVTL